MESTIISTISYGNTTICSGGQRHSTIFDGDTGGYRDIGAWEASALSWGQNWEGERP